VFRTSEDIQLPATDRTPVASPSSGHKLEARIMRRIHIKENAAGFGLDQHVQGFPFALAPRELVESLRLRLDVVQIPGLAVNFDGFRSLAFVGTAIFLLPLRKTLARAFKDDTFLIEQLRSKALLYLLTSQAADAQCQYVCVRGARPLSAAYASTRFDSLLRGKSTEVGNFSPSMPRSEILRRITSMEDSEKTRPLKVPPDPRIPLESA
jgi:hypothetical protein